MSYKRTADSRCDWASTTHCDRRLHLINYRLVGAAICLMLIAILINTWCRGHDPDELETLAAASFIFNGKVIYRDFYNIHTPLSFYFFSPLCFFFKTMKIFYAARLISYILLVLNGYFLFKISQYLFSRKVAIFSILSYLVCLPVLDTMIEIRPDTLVVTFSNISLIFLLWNRPSAVKYFFLAGIFGALAVLSKQSGIVFIAGVVIFLFIRAVLRNAQFWDNEVFQEKRFNFKTYCSFMAGFLLPCIIFIFLLLRLGVFAAFWNHAVDNDFISATFLSKFQGVRIGPYRYLVDIIMVNCILFSSSIAFVFHLCLKKYRERMAIGGFILFFVLFGASFISLFYTYQAWRQDFLLMAQYIALMSAPMLTFAYEYTYLYRVRKQKTYGIALRVSLLLLVCLPPLYKMLVRTDLYNIYGTKILFSASVPELVQPHAFVWLMAKLEKYLGNNAGMIRAHNQIISLTNNHDMVLSVSEPIPFRPSVYYFRITDPLWGGSSYNERIEKLLIEEVLNNDIIVVHMPNRQLQFIEFMPDFWSTLVNYYIKNNGFYVPGKIFYPHAAAQPAVFNVIVEGYYEIQGYWEGARIDDKLLKENLVYLQKGKHFVYVPEGKESIIIFYSLAANKREIK